MWISRSPESQSESAGRQTRRQPVRSTSRVRSAMAIAIGDYGGQDASPFHVFLDVGKKADKRNPARNDTEDGVSDGGAWDAPDPPQRVCPADDRGGNRIE